MVKEKDFIRKIMKNEQNIVEINRKNANIEFFVNPIYIPFLDTRSVPSARRNQQPSSRARPSAARWFLTFDARGWLLFPPHGLGRATRQLMLPHPTMKKCFLCDRLSAGAFSAGKIQFFACEACRRRLFYGKIALSSSTACYKNRTSACVKIRIL